MLDANEKTNCLFVANTLRKMDKAVKYPQQLSICASMLEDVALHMNEYKQTSIVSLKFFEEILKATEEITDREKENNHDSNLSCNSVLLIYDTVFAILEDAVLVVRENVLRDGQKIRKAQIDILDYFSKSGHWEPEKRTIINDFYYIQIPIGVLRSLVEEKKKLGAF